MTSDLLTPATPDLLDGWCGPVVWADEEAPHVLAVALGTGPDPVTGGVVLWTEVGDRLVRPARLRLDLSRAECRDRAARVLAQRRSGKPCPNGVRLAVAQGVVGAILILHTEHGAEWFYPRSGELDQAKVGAEILTHAHTEAFALRLCLEATRG